MSDNDVTSAAGNGIVVQGGAGNTLTSNTLDGSAGSGILVGDAARGTTMSDCTVTGGSVGLVNEGSDTAVATSTITGARWADVLDIGTTPVRLSADTTFGSLSHDGAHAPAR